MKINRNNGLRSAHGIDGKQINGILIRMPHTKSNTKFPSKLGAVHDSKGQRIRGLWWRTPHGAALVASRIGPAFLLDRAQTNAGHEFFRVAQIPVVVMLRGKRTYTDTQRCHGEKGSQF